MEANSDQEPRLAKIALSKPVAVSAFTAPVALGLGSYFPGPVRFFETHVVVLDPWSSTESGWKWAMVGILIMLTALMFMKQWSYYYTVGKGKGGFFVDTCGCFNDLEWNLDLLLSLWGGFLFLAAFRMPSCWLPLSAVYSLLVAVRCRVTLKRSAYVAHWRQVGEAEGRRFWTLFDTYPRRQILPVARKAALCDRDSAPINEWNARLAVMEESLDWAHPTAVYGDPRGRRLLRAREILSGWVWSHHLFFPLGLIYSIVSGIILFFNGPGPVAALSIGLLALAQVCVFRSVSRASELCGIEIAAKTTPPQE